MDLRDLVKLAGIVNPELLNKIEPTAEVEEADGAGFEDATTRPQEEMMDDPMATMGSDVDTSLRRYLKAKGDHVTVDEEIYPDHTVESVTEAYAEFKEGKKKKKYGEELDEAACGCCNEDPCNCEDDCSCKESITEAPYQYDMSDKGDMHDALGEVQNSMDDAVKSIQKAAGLASQVHDEIENSLYPDESVEEAMVDEDDVEEDNAFNTAAANAKKAGQSHFTFNNKKYKVKMDDKTADALTDDIALLKQLAGL